jgi:hypothetical protein
VSPARAAAAANAYAARATSPDEHLRMPKQPRWIVTTDGARPIREVAAELERAGFTVAKVLGELGSIAGTASAKSIERVRGIRGVADVSPDEPIDLGPPGGDTW